MDFPKIIDELEYQLKKLQDSSPLKADQKRKLDEKFRLELNFNSNHIEGNTLTYGETQLLLLRGKISGDHEKQEIDEMSAHDTAYSMIKDWAKDDSRDMTESDLRELNQIILVRPFWKEAITSDGQATRKRIIPGEYKSTPNHVKQKDGQIHYYSTPEETPAKMEELMGWYKSRDSEKYPVIRAARAHHEFTKIHPFDDGNGRVSRLWSNYILLKAGYPPLIIKSINKPQYLTALAKADAGDLQPFVTFMSNELMWSLNLCFKASRGEQIDELGDIGKRIDLIDKKINSISSNEAKTPSSVNTANEIIENSFKPLIQVVESSLTKVKNWFNKMELTWYHEGSGYTYNDFDLMLLDQMLIKENKIPRYVKLEIKFEGFKKAGTKAFDIYNSVQIDFHKWSYDILLEPRSDKLYSKLNDEHLSEMEIRTVSEALIQKVVEGIELRMKQLGF